jgi:outer membrane protein TolC
MSKRPDFSAGLQAEVYKPPFYWPQASMTLPIWRDKIAAQVAAARAGVGAAHARLDAAKIQLTVDFTMKTHEYRELSRSLVLLREKLLPKARQSLDAARAGYRSGQVDFLGVIDAARTLLDLQLEEVEVKTQREIVLADLSLTIVGVAPEGAPLLRE